MSQQHTAVICARNGVMLESLVTRAGYDVLGVAEMAVHAEHLVRHYEPDVVIVENALTGISGLEGLRLLEDAAPDSRFVFVVEEDWTPDDLGAIGAFAVITRSHLADLVDELGALDAWLEAEEQRPVELEERRSGRDRRTDQDWSKVGWEKRTTDRRSPSPA